MQSSGTVDVGLMNRGPVDDQKLYDVSVSGGGGHLQWCAPVVATGCVDVRFVTEKNWDDRQELIAHRNVKSRNFVSPTSATLYRIITTRWPLCKYVCNTITLENLDAESSLLVCGYILNGCGSSSYMKVIGSRSRSQEQKYDNPYSRNVKLWSAASLVPLKMQPWSLRTAMDFRLQRIEWCDRHLCHRWFSCTNMTHIPWRYSQTKI